MCSRSRMFGEDSAGRKVSLLNDEPTAKSLHQPSTKIFNHKIPSPYTSLPSLPKKRFLSSTTSSCSTSPETSPSTPPLVRLNSISSVGTQTTPSPMSPHYPLDPFVDQQKNGHPYYSYQRQLNGNGYPAMPTTQEPAAQPYYMAPHPMNDREMEEAFLNNSALRSPPALEPIHTQGQYQNTDPALTLSPQTALPPQAATQGTSTAQTTKADKATATTPTSAGPKGPKKKYPCPHAAKYSCSDTFTTSGHAARHGKKHTGEKNIHCPTCHKAFTRKDNMKQHERTHKNARNDPPSPTDPTAPNNSKSTTAASRSRRPAPKTSNSESEKAKLAPEAPMMEFDGDAASLQLTQEAHGLPLPPPDIMQDVKPNLNGRMPSISGRSEVDGEGDSPGLDALAHVAASEMVP